MANGIPLLGRASPTNLGVQKMSKFWRNFGQLQTSPKGTYKDIDKLKKALSTTTPPTFERFKQSTNGKRRYLQRSLPRSTKQNW